MLNTILKSLFGTANSRTIASTMKTVQNINDLETHMVSLSDSQLRAKTEEFKQKLSRGSTLSDILHEAFAVTRETARRVLGLRQYDVQLAGGIILHQGNIAEMRTGEGKTLVATAPVYLHALRGKGVHVVTVNDYLAKRDAQWMGAVYTMLGLTTGVVVSNMEEADRKKAYACDITYATNNELGFDFLRDTLQLNMKDMVQRGHDFAIVDEVDSILIDEARTPLIISGPADASSDIYLKVDAMVKTFDRSWVEKDEKNKDASLSEKGLKAVEDICQKRRLLHGESLFAYKNIFLLHHINQAVKAHFAFRIEKDYIVDKGKVIIIDEFTGRSMQGRRYGEGLHQAIEAKENVKVRQENQTLASITFQNYFRMYKTLSGMTGTAMTEAGEFEEIYRLNSVEIPTNLPSKRLDHQDQIYRTSVERDMAIVEQVKKCTKLQQPILIGTSSIEQSDHFSKLLKKTGIKHHVLNAKNHMAEAEIIANAGALGAVTIATNMAGRGTDIKLGGRDATKEHYQAVLKAGGLFVLGTERHEARRIDNQLRGRSGRQGDVGETKFYLSLEDNLMRVFGSQNMKNLLKKLGLKTGEAISHPWVSRALERAQQKVEAHNFDIRKQLIKYDDVSNEQRKVMLALRKEYMTTKDIFGVADEMRYQTLEGLVEKSLKKGVPPAMWEMGQLHKDIKTFLALELTLDDWKQEQYIDDQKIFIRIKNASDAHVEKLRKVDKDLMQEGTRSILLQTLDFSWKEHLLHLDHLRQGIGLRAYGQKDPLNEYKAEAYDLFENFLHTATNNATQCLSYMVLESASAIEEQTPQSSYQINLEQESPEHKKPSRNSPCPCGSGKKYKRCCGARH